MASSANLSPLLLFIKLSLLISTIDSTAAKSCQKANSCSAGSLAVRFPFQLLSDPDNQDRQQPRCGYPGFELWCNHTETESESAEIMISLPSGVFTVKGIFYESQVLTIDDPAKCLPNRFLERNFTLLGTPFSITNLGSYTFLNCSSSAKLDFRGEGFEPIPCLSGKGYTVIAKPTMLFESTPSFCGVLATVMVPVVSSNRWWVDYSWEVYLRAYVGMAWHEPRCGDCEVRGGDCGFTGQAGLQIGCFNLRKHGIVVS